MKKIFLPIVLSLMISGCSNAPSPSGGTIEREGEPPIEQVAADDKAMNAAIEKARDSAPNFARALQSPKANQSEFSVKARFAQGEVVEHMWLGDVTYKSGEFSGTVSNNPNNLTNVKTGDKVTVNQRKISDWMYVENDKLVGGYTIRAIRDALPPEKQKEFVKNLPFKVD